MKTRYKEEQCIPGGFETFPLKELNGDICSEQLDMRNKELVFISAPAEFDINLLKGEQYVTHGSKLINIDEPNNEGVAQKWELHSSSACSDKHLNILLASDVQHKHVLASTLSVTLNVVRGIQMPTLKSPKKKKHVIRIPKPSGLRERWTPFGSGNPNSQMPNVGGMNISRDECEKAITPVKRKIKLEENMEVDDLKQNEKRYSVNLNDLDDMDLKPGKTLLFKPSMNSNGVQNQETETGKQEYKTDHADYYTHNSHEHNECGGKDVSVELMKLHEMSNKENDTKHIESKITEDERTTTAQNMFSIRSKIMDGNSPNHNNCKKKKKAKCKKQDGEDVDGKPAEVLKEIPSSGHIHSQNVSSKTEVEEYVVTHTEKKHKKKKKSKSLELNMGEGDQDRKSKVFDEIEASEIKNHDQECILDESGNKKKKKKKKKSEGGGNPDDLVDAKPITIIHDNTNMTECDIHGIKRENEHIENTSSNHGEKKKKKKKKKSEGGGNSDDLVAGKPITIIHDNTNMNECHIQEIKKENEHIENTTSNHGEKKKKKKKEVVEMQACKTLVDEKPVNHINNNEEHTNGIVKNKRKRRKRRHGKYKPETLGSEQVVDVKPSTLSHTNESSTSLTHNTTELCIDNKSSISNTPLSENTKKKKGKKRKNENTVSHIKHAKKQKLESPSKQTINKSADSDLDSESEAALLGVVSKKRIFSN